MSSASAQTIRTIAERIPAETIAHTTANTTLAGSHTTKATANEADAAATETIQA